MAGLVQAKLFNTALMASARLMNGLKRKREIERLGLLKPGLNPAAPVINGPLSLEQEIYLPDEERDWTLSSKSRVCPGCGWCVYLTRKKIEGKLRFRVHCDTPHCKHPYDTDWLPSSEEAVSVWRMAVLLATK